jgi:hypothetical protein
VAGANGLLRFSAFRTSLVSVAIDPLRRRPRLAALRAREPLLPRSLWHSELDAFTQQDCFSERNLVSDAHNLAVLVDDVDPPRSAFVRGVAERNSRDARRANLVDFVHQC